MLTIGASVFGVVKFSIKAHKTYITQTCKSKKIYNCAIVLSQIYDGTVAISQISYNIFYSKITTSLSLFSVSSSLPLSKTLQAPLSLAHSGGSFMVWAWVRWRHGSWVWWRNILVSNDGLLKLTDDELLKLADDWDLCSRSPMIFLLLMGFCFLVFNLIVGVLLILRLSFCLDI